MALTVGPHPGLELFDALALTDSVLPPLTMRITGLELSFYPLDGLHELIISGEGM